MDQQRFVGIVIAFTTVAITLLVLGQFEREAEGKIEVTCVDPTERERVRDLSLRAVDDGFTQAVITLFSVWQKDPDHEQPRRAQVGMANTINAHARARKLALAWNPPSCAPGE